MATETPQFRAQFAAAAIGMTAGISAWVLLGAYQEDSGRFFLACLLMAIAYPALAARSAIAFSLCLIAGVMPLSLFTAHQGDGDGLWLLIVPMLAVFGLVLALIGGVGGRMLRARGGGVNFSRRLSDHFWPIGGTCVVVSGVLIAVTLGAGSYPWGDLYDVLDEAQLPSQFQVQETYQSGSPRRMSNAGVVREVLFSSRGSSSDCAVLHDMFTQWADVGTVTWRDGEGDFLCGGSGTIVRGEALYSVELDAWSQPNGGTRVVIEVVTPSE